jgi:hypothetical protein
MEMNNKKSLIERILEQKLQGARISSGGKRGTRGLTSGPRTGTAAACTDCTDCGDCGAPPGSGCDNCDTCDLTVCTENCGDECDAECLKER